MAGTARVAAVRAYTEHLARRLGLGRRRPLVWVTALAACAVAAFVVGVALAGGMSKGGSGQPTNPAAAPAASILDDLPTGWTELPAPPEVRIRAATAWTGERLLVWGGYVFTGFSDEVAQSTGFEFDAGSRTWSRIPASELAPRVNPASAWTGTEFLVWGGTDERSEHFFGDGSAYDPATRTWRLLPPAPVSPRAPLAVWTGREFVLWGTTARVDPRHRDGAAYDRATDSWRSIADAPIELTDATAVWSGREMIVFGAALHGGNFPETTTAIGAAYDPATDSWRRLPDSNLSPQASTAAWDGRELIAWDYLHGSAAYDPAADRWRRLPDVELWSGECSPESVSLHNYVLGHFCGGLLVIHDPADDRWHDVSLPRRPNWGFELVAAGSVALLLGRNTETGAQQMLAYRPG